MESNKELYLKSIILLNDITKYHNDLNEEKEWNNKLRLFKNCFVALDIFRDSLKSFSKLQTNHSKLILLGKDIKKQLQFIHHLRNKISGHIDPRLLSKAVQWEPSIFMEAIKENKEGQLSLVYKTLLESAINSFIDKDSNQRVFDTEIDLHYPPNRTLFFNYIGEVNTNSMNYLELITDILDQQIEYWSEDKMIEMAKNAGNTDFNLQ